ncbi:hypothetical protein QQF64_015151, partial [Cirrhinus molitorella]
GFMSEDATLWSSGSGYKLLMGSGTKLIVQTKEEVKPSYYKLNQSCLATDFTKHNAVNFTANVTSVRYTGQNYYSIYSFTDEDKCPEEGCGSGSSSGGFES